MLLLVMTPSHRNALTRVNNGRFMLTFCCLAGMSLESPSRHTFIHTNNNMVLCAKSVTAMANTRRPI